MICKEGRVVVDKPFSWHKSPLRPEVLKICFTLLHQPLSEEEYEAENGLNCCCSSSTALRTIAINQFSWTDILVLLGYHVDACVCRLRIA